MVGDDFSPQTTSAPYLHAQFGFLCSHPLARFVQLFYHSTARLKLLFGLLKLVLDVVKGSDQVLG